MRNISFQNEGLIDMRAVKTFGVCSKVGGTPIGFFGTGLKYAIAVSLRNGCEVSLFRGEDEYKFDVAPTKIRVNDFNLVTMLDVVRGQKEELAFTTELGKTWETWQALREFWCNALDEGGDIHSDALTPLEDHTTIVVTGEAIVHAYNMRDEIMLQGEAKWFHQGVEIHYKKSSKAYYRSVRVNNLKEPAVLTYNCVGHSLELTEDRTLKYSYLFDTHCRDALASSDSETLLRELIDAPKGTFEASLDFSDCDPGPLLMRMLDDEDFRGISNNSLLVMYRKQKGTALKPTDVAVDSNETMMLAKALTFLKKIGYHVEDYPIHVTDDLAEHILGQAYEGAIYISRRCFMRGTKMVAGTILEEWIHLHHKLHDETRALQDYLLDALVTMGEKFVGEPL